MLKVMTTNQAHAGLVNTVLRTVYTQKQMYGDSPT